MTRVLLACILALVALPTSGVAQESAATSAGQDDRSGPTGQGGDATVLPEFIPALTDADRAAAFPDLDGHRLHDSAVNYLVLFDQFERHAGAGSGAFNWDTKGWVGTERDRLWFRSEGERSGDGVAGSQTHLLFGRAISPWWEAVAGIRQDVRPGNPQAWAAIGLQGLAPYLFEVEITGYLGAAGRTQLRVEVEYELLVTNRLILQPLVELEVHGKADPARGIGAGLTHADAGLRLRYEFRREVAPYIGLAWNRKFFGSADLAEASGDPVGGARLAFGLRMWL